MARVVHSRLRITGELIAETPLHVGGYGESFETDLALARSGKGDFYVPGSSLTGTLRSWFEKNFGEDETIRIWGWQETEKKKVGTKDDRSKASFVIVEDLTLPGDVQTELRNGVGIDRLYGAAADKAKFDRAILAKGTRLKLEITVDLKDNANKIMSNFESMLAALQSGQIRLGAAKTRGLGRVTCGPITIEEYSLNTFDGILGAVSRKPTKTDHIKKFKVTAPAELLTIKISWSPKSPVMVKADYDGIGVDMLPLTSGNGKDKDGKDQVSLVLPGSSIKGAFRAQAERIVRTVLDIDAPRNPTDPQNFSKQVRMLNKDGKEPAPDSKEGEASELIGLLFGAKKERLDNDESEQEKKRNKRLGLGALSIDDCYFDKQMNASEWLAVETGKITKTVKDKDGKPHEEDVSYSEQELWQALKRIEGDIDLVSPTREFSISHHVAIDRWTGGAADGALYSVLQPTAKIGWDDICLTLDLSRLRDVDGNPDEALRKRSLMLLLLVLRDFAEERLPLGFATNRGMGEVEDVNFTTTGPFEIKWKDGQFQFSDPNLKLDLEKEWQEWLKDHTS